MNDLRERVAIVTGASGAIGAATVRALARRGAHVVLAAPESQLALLDSVALEAISLGVRTLVVPTDVTDRAQIEALVAKTNDAFDRVDILVNVAGISSSPSICRDTDENVERVVAINLLGSVWAIRAVLPSMKRRRCGAIVNIGSVAGEAGVLGIYSASKFGVRGLSDSVRREVRSFGIGVSLIEPGFVRSPMNAAMGDGLPSPDIVAAAVVRAIRSRRRRIVVPWQYRPAVYLANIFPGLIDLVFGDARIQQRLNRDWVEQKTKETV